MKGITLAVAAVLLAGAAAVATAEEKPMAGPLDRKMKGIDGKDVDLSQYKGKVVLVVNVASQCGYTPQYEGLQELYAKHEKDGLVVVGVPSNEFGKQEPGTNEEIEKFCTDKYHVTFPMLSKVVVKGKGQVPLYKYLTSKETDPKFAGDIKWNFTKFLVGRNGEIVARFEPAVKPSSDEMIKAVEAELKKK